MAALDLLHSGHLELLLFVHGSHSVMGENREFEV